MSKVLKKIAPIALPILGTMIPGVGPVLGGALGGAAGGLASGKGFKGALSGAALGGIGGGLTGGAGGLLGKSAGTFGPATGAQVAAAGGNTNLALSNLAQGSGLKGILSGGAGNLSNIAKVGTSLYGGVQDDRALKQARDAMLQSQGRASNMLQPYSEMGLGAQQQLSSNLAAGFNPGDLTKDTGYQFRLNEGMGKLQESLAAQGLGQSGDALKALERYRQDYAANEYQSAYDRWLQQNSQLGDLGAQGLGTAGSLGGLQLQGGKAIADYNVGQRQDRNKRIAELLAGLDTSA